MSDAAGMSGGLPLNVYNTKMPPGWKPGDPKHSFKAYEQLVRLWIRQTDLRPEQIGIAMIGRLYGQAFQLGLRIQRLRWDPVSGETRLMAGDELLAQGSTTAGVDAAGNNIPAQVHGGSVLLDELKAEYGQHIQETYTKEGISSKAPFLITATLLQELKSNVDIKRAAAFISFGTFGFGPAI